MGFNSGAEICTLRSQIFIFQHIIPPRLYLPNAEMTLDLEVNEVEVKGLTSLASVPEITGVSITAKVVGRVTTENCLAVRILDMSYLPLSSFALATLPSPAQSTP